MYLVMTVYLAEHDATGEAGAELPGRIEGSPAHNVSFDVDKASNFRIGDGLRAFDLAEIADYIEAERDPENH